MAGTKDQATSMSRDDLDRLRSWQPQFAELGIDAPLSRCDRLLYTNPARWPMAVSSVPSVARPFRQDRFRQDGAHLGLCAAAPESRPHTQGPMHLVREVAHGRHGHRLPRADFPNVPLHQGVALTTVTPGEKAI